MIFCQSCKASNSTDREFCEKCNTRLMITTTPRFNGGEGVIGHTMEEHLLERISNLEYMVMRMQDRFERLLDVMHRQATSHYYDHMLLDALSEVLAENKVITKEHLEQIWQQRIKDQMKQSDTRTKYESRRKKILSLVKTETPQKFFQLIDDAFHLLTQNESRRGVRILEKASLLAPNNVELNFFLGEHFYYQEKFILAGDYLKKVLIQDPEHYAAHLMLGIICAEDGELELAKESLAKALTLKKDSFVAHLGLGQLFASEGRSSEALNHLKSALMLNPAPELYFMVGQVYFLRGEFEIALKHLQKAVDGDPRFDAALYQLGVIYLRRKHVDKAREYFRAAYEINPLARYRSALRARAGRELPVLPAFSQAQVVRRRLLTSGDTRLVNLLRNALMKQAD